MGAQPSSSPRGARHVSANPNPRTIGHQELQEKEARPARRCLPLAWSGVSETEDENEDGLPAKARQPTEAWEARPFSSQSTASTLNTSTGKHIDTMSSFRPTTSGSQMSLPSTATPSPGSKRSRASRRSRFSRSGSLPSSADSSGSILREAALCASELPNARELALNDVKLEDARQRATKSLEALQAKLRASRAEAAHSEAKTRNFEIGNERAQGSPAFAARPERGHAWASHHGTSATSSEGFSFSASARSAGEAPAEAPRKPSQRPAGASQEAWDRSSMLRPQPSVLGQRYADAADGV